jgi:hypothetical protein
MYRRDIFNDIKTWLLVRQILNRLDMVSYQHEVRDIEREIAYLTKKHFEEEY